jgi:hypothetical protein
VGEFTGLSASPEFMSIETPGGITHERTYPGEFNLDPQDSFWTTYPGDIFQGRSVGGPIISSLQLFLLNTTTSGKTSRPKFR